MLKSIIQEETTGCGIASVANILGRTYSEMKGVANAMGIYASDKSLWSDTQYVRRMLSSAGVKTSTEEIPFESWEALPDLALLSIKHHWEEGKNSGIGVYRGRRCITDIFIAVIAVDCSDSNLNSRQRKFIMLRKLLEFWQITDSTASS